MKKTALIVFLTLLLSGCTSKDTYKSEKDLKNPPKRTENAMSKPVIKTSYLPQDWVIENGFYYSPETYASREGGPYSLRITVNNGFSSLEEYAIANKDCIKNKKELSVKSSPAISFTNECFNMKPKVTVIQINNVLVESFSYSFSDESKEISKILDTLELQ